MAPKCLAPKRHGTELSSAESAAPSQRRRVGGAETAAPKWPSPISHGGPLQLKISGRNSIGRKNGK